MRDDLETDFWRLMRSAGVPDAEIDYRWRLGVDRQIGTGWCDAGRHESAHADTFGVMHLHDPSTTWAFCSEHEHIARLDVVRKAFEHGMSRVDVLARIAVREDDEDGVMHRAASEAELPADQESKPVSHGPLRVVVDPHVDYQRVFNFYADMKRSLPKGGEGLGDGRQEPTPVTDRTEAHLEAVVEQLGALITWIGDPEGVGREVVLGPIHGDLYEASLTVMVVLFLLKPTKQDALLAELGIDVEPVFG